MTYSAKAPPIPAGLFYLGNFLDTAFTVYSYIVLPKPDMPEPISSYPDEKELLSQLQAGSHKAFEAIYHRYKVRLAGNLLRILKSPELVDDLLQELFTRLWTHRRNIDPQQSIQAYLFRIASNLTCDTFRRLSRDKKMQQRVYHSIAEAYSHIEERIFALENRESIYQTISLLPPKRREVFILCKLEAKSYAEVSRLMNISHKTINDHIYKANQFLKDYFATQVLIYLLLTSVGTLSISG